MLFRSRKGDDLDAVQRLSGASPGMGAGCDDHVEAALRKALRDLPHHFLHPADAGRILFAAQQNPAA